MRSAFGTSILFALLCLAGFVSMLFSAVTLIGSLPRGASPASILEACCGVVLARLSVGWLLPVAVAAALVFVLVRIARSTWRLAAAGRGIGRLRRVSEPAEVSGVSCRIYEDSRPLAFCAGILRPEIFVSRAAAEQMPAEVIGVVMAHEQHHRLRRDPLRRAVAGILTDGFFFLPVLGQIGRKCVSLSEAGADRAAAAASAGGRGDVARALLAFPAGAGSPGEASLSGDRIEHLAGGCRIWMPTWPMLALTIVALLALLSAPVVSAELLLVDTVNP
ncbi:MAG TPA: hypothetical protein VMF31_08545 [Solirubrobacterales bacterium]|nr:hypothetical protein [Solirubrobacterales bacterium]